MTQANAHFSIEGRNALLSDAGLGRSPTLQSRWASPAPVH